jgi:coenzyme PQQ precursor peptide PqqA
MSWKAPKVAEVAVGMEINMYACAEWKAPAVAEVPVGMEINMYACATRK